jgi:hypothetical protein
MPIGFPPTPTIGQQWPTVSPRWEWDGTKWRALSTLGSGATPITDTLTTLAGSDNIIALRSGVPYLASMAAVQTFVGGVPSATAPAAFTAGQWTATAGTELIELNITALAADGGSAITALQYRLGTGAAVALTGTGTGIRQITGLTGDTAYDVQIRAVNAIGSGEWSDVKTRTPAASDGGGDPVWISVTSSSGPVNTSGFTPTYPASVGAADTLVCVITVISATGAPAMTAPEGWSYVGGAFTDFGTNNNIGAAVYVASGSDYLGLWSLPVLETVQFDIHRISGASITPVRVFAGTAAHLDGFSIGSADMPSPSVTAVEGDLVMSHYYQPQTATAVGTPQDGYTRVVDSDAPSRRSTIIRASAPAGATGPISHNANAPWEARAAFSLVIRS